MSAEEITEKLKSFDVILTTFEMIAKEFKDIGYLNNASYLFHSKFNRLVVDEVNMLVNQKSQKSQSVNSIQSEFRYGLTGTPIENSINDLQSYLRFLQVESFSDFAIWNRSVSQLTTDLEKLKHFI